ncbi:MAG: hypothetical protein IJO45_03780 [Oscillospiraceae bacterium]|nr:hypothetical protein [Oscillospiraceae bacterium]
MSDRRKRYNQLQQMIGLALLGALVLFIFYWIAAGNEIVWLKVVLSILIFLICAACLGYLFITQELMRPRSLWMTLGAAAIALCLLLSLILHFPCPNPRTLPLPTVDDLAALKFLM